MSKNTLQRALNYAPTDPPQGVDPTLANWLKREFFSVYLSQKSVLLLQPVSREPSPLEIGIIAYADGDNWNPGSGEGPYVWTSTGWKSMT